MISVDNLTVSFGGWDLFKDISLLVNPKDRIGLVGKNGAAGKFAYVGKQLVILRIRAVIYYKQKQVFYF